MQELPVEFMSTSAGQNNPVSLCRNNKRKHRQSILQGSKGIIISLATGESYCFKYFWSFILCSTFIRLMKQQLESWKPECERSFFYYLFLFSAAHKNKAAVNSTFLHQKTSRMITTPICFN